MIIFLIAFKCLVKLTFPNKLNFTIYQYLLLIKLRSHHQHTDKGYSVLCGLLCWLNGAGSSSSEESLPRQRSSVSSDSESLSGSGPRLEMLSETSLQLQVARGKPVIVGHYGPAHVVSVSLVFFSYAVTPSLPCGQSIEININFFKFKSYKVIKDVF